MPMHPHPILPSRQRRRRRSKPALARVIPGPDASDLLAWEQALASLVLEPPLSLELVGEAGAQWFQVRAPSEAALQQAMVTMQSVWPSCQFERLSPVDEDWTLAQEDQVDGIRLRVRGRGLWLWPAGGPERPLRAVPAAAGFQVGALARPSPGLSPSHDPLGQVLAALIPGKTGERLVLQLVIRPAPSTATAGVRRRLEHLLQAERRQALTLKSETSWGTLLLGALVLGLVGLGWMSQSQPQLSRWLLPLFLGLLQLSSAQSGVAPGLDLGLFVGSVCCCLLLLLVLARRRRQDQELLWQDSRVFCQRAFRVQLRLIRSSPRPRARPPQQSSNGGQQLSRFVTTPCQHWIWRWPQQRLLRRQQQREVTLRLLAALRRLEGEISARWQARRLSQRAMVRLLRSGGFWGTRGPGSWLPGRWDLIPARSVALLWHLPCGPLDPASWPLLLRQPARRLPLPATLRAGQDQEGERNPGPGLAAPTASEQHAPVLTWGVAPGPGADTRLIPFPWSLALTGHTLICGRTGEGKSTLLLGLALEAARAGMGMVVIDPHDLIQRLLPLLPRRTEEVILLDFGAPEKPGFNPLDARLTLQQGDKVIVDLLGSFRDLWEAQRSWGPRMEACFEGTLRLLYRVNQQLVLQGAQDRQLTLLEALPILTNQGVRHRLLRWLQPDPLLARWWTDYFEPLTSWMKLERIDPILTKLAKFEGTGARQILGQSCSLDLVRWLREGRVVLLRLAPEEIGEDAARLLGATILNLLTRWAQAQPFPPTLVIVDEFQWLPGCRWRIGEMRKFGLRYTLASQSLESFRTRSPGSRADQLAELLVNTQTLVAFATSAGDASLLAPELGLTPKEILDLPRFQCYVRLAPLQGSRQTCSCLLQAPAAPSETGQQLARRIREHCRQLGRPVAVTEQQLLERQAWLCHPWGTEAQAKTASEPTQGGQGEKPGPEAGAEIGPAPAWPPLKKYRGRRAEERRELAALRATLTLAPGRVPQKPPLSHPQPPHSPALAQQAADLAVPGSAATEVAGPGPGPGPGSGRGASHQPHQPPQQRLERPRPVILAMVEPEPEPGGASRREDSGPEHSRPPLQQEGGARSRRGER